MAFALPTETYVSTGHRAGLILAWAFVLSRSVGLGMTVPEAAYQAPEKRVCEAVRETVALLVDERVHVSECRDSEKIYIGVPIYGSTPGPA